MDPRSDDASGLLDRRLFLKAGLHWSTIAAAPALADDAAAALPTTRTPGAPMRSYGQPSAQESATLRWISANRAVPGNGVSWTPLEALEGTITPSGLHFERHHNGVPAIDAARHRLVIDGAVRRPQAWSIADLLRYSLRSRVCFVECGGNSNAGWHAEPQQTRAGTLHGLASNSEWTGVPLRLLLDEAGVDRQARWLLLEAADAVAMNVSLPLAKARDDCLLALYQNGERLRPEQGYPLRLLVPGWEGVLNVKWLSRIELSREPLMSRNETSRYTELQPDGRARQFTFVMDVKSLITTPSHGQRLDGPGLYELRGLAWSGRGRIRRVEVSADGGRQWRRAALEGPVLPAAFTRFRIPWRWDGQPAVLQSRAIDDSGAVQPTRAELIARRGRAGYFHYHAITSWAVDAEGELSHVYA